MIRLPLGRTVARLLFAAHALGMPLATRAHAQSAGAPRAHDAHQDRSPGVRDHTEREARERARAEFEARKRERRECELAALRRLMPGIPDLGPNSAPLPCASFHGDLALTACVRAEHEARQQAAARELAQLKARAVCDRELNERSKRERVKREAHERTERTARTARECEVLAARELASQRRAEAGHWAEAANRADIMARAEHAARECEVIAQAAQVDARRAMTVRRALQIAAEARDRTTRRERE